MRFRNRIALCNLLGTAILVPITAQHALAASTPIYSLGTLGGTSSSALAINESGQVTGISDGYSAFLYSGTPGSGGVMADLGTLPDLGALPGGDFSVGWAINASGQVTGNSGIRGMSSYAFLYTGAPGNGGTMLNLGTLGGQNDTSMGVAINNVGQVAGWSTIGGTGQHAFLYTGIPGNGGVMADLGVRAPIIAGRNGLAVNDSGQVAGGYAYDLPADDSHAFLYTGQPGHGGTLMDLGTLSGNSSGANAINNNGQIVGWSFLQSDRNEYVHAFLYTGVPGHGGAMTDLGTLGLSAAAEAINDNGAVVGSGSTIDDVEHAFLYTGTPGLGGHMIDLDAWLDATNPVEGAKWTLTSAEGINDRGLIVGTGTYDDGVPADSGKRAFLLDASALVPEPGSLWLLALGSAALFSRRRTRP